MSLNMWEDKTLLEVIKAAIEKRLSNVHTGIPAMIESYDSTTQKATVLPMVKYRIKGSEAEMSLPTIPSVPVGHLNSNGGSAFMQFPVVKGDLGFLTFSEASMEKYLSSNGKKPDDSGSFRRFNLVDAVFIPMSRPFNVALDTVEDNEIVIRNNDAQIRIADGKFQIRGAGAELLQEITDAIVDAKDLTSALDEYIAAAKLCNALEASAWSALNGDPALSGATHTAAAAAATGASSLITSSTGVQAILTGIEASLNTIKSKIEGITI